MKIVHLNAFDQRGGAAIAVSRLHRALLAVGVDSQLLVQFQSSAEARVTGPGGKWGKALALLADTLDPLPLKIYPGRSETIFSCNWIASRAVGRAKREQPDVLNLHWINAGMLRPRSLLSIDVPMVWTLHDMWPFTGGCHYSGDCVGYHAKCGNCPALGSTRYRDLSSIILAGKRKAWTGLPIVPVAPSEWLADRARQSRLFDGHEVIVMPHGVDRSVYQPWDQAMARSILQLPQGKLVMFSAAKGLQTPHKNVAAVHRILGSVKQQLPEVNLVVMGAGPPSGVPEETSLHYLGHLHDDVSRALAFAAVDALLIPSKEEAFGNVVLESLACGTPVAAYATGAAPDLLRDERCGTAVAIGDEPGLVEALLSLLSRDDTDRQVVRAATDGHGLSDMAAAYRDLYQQLCGTA